MALKVVLVLVGLLFTALVYPMMKQALPLCGSGGAIGLDEEQRTLCRLEITDHHPHV
jgi:hypothetical protein